MDQETFLTLWGVAGFFIGWIGIDLAGGFADLRVPYSFNVACGFIGALIAYTVFR